MMILGLLIASSMNINTVSYIHVMSSSSTLIHNGPIA